MLAVGELGDWAEESDKFLYGNYLFQCFLL